MDPTLEQENPIVSKDITISETLSKSVTIDTKNYNLKDIQRDEDGNDDIIADFRDTNFVEEFKDRYYTINELLKEVPQFLNTIRLKLNKTERVKADVLAYCCRGWNEDEIEAVTD